MSLEERKLVLKDICAKLLHGVKFPYHMDEDCNHSECNAIATIDTVDDCCVEFTYEQNGRHIDWTCAIYEVKPYLRPLSSMTEEEKKISNQFIKNIMYQGADAVRLYVNRYTDWLDSNFFDWRTDGNGKTLIELDLALPAPEGMYD